MKGYAGGGAGWEWGGYIGFGGSLKIHLVAQSLENDAVGLIRPWEQAAWGVAMEISLL